MSDDKNDVGLFLRAMVDREPGKRKVKPSKTALIDLSELDLGESSDDSDFNVDEAKLKEDDDISINSEDGGNSDDEDEDSDDDEDDDENNCSIISQGKNINGNSHLSVKELLEVAEAKQLSLEANQTIERPKILVCSICLGESSDDMNEIVTCDGCHVSVHEGCYGISDTISISSTVSSSSTEPWFCDACKAGVTDPPCELCPNIGYTIFKETEMGRWVHLVCALYIPGVAFSEVDKLSFPTLFEMPYSRYGSKYCTLCEDERFSKTGICIGCDAGMCKSYFHVTCAQREGLLSEVNHYEADQADPYYAHCKLHSDRELMKRRRRNWLALQLHMKQGQRGKASETRETQDRLKRKLLKYTEKYNLTKANRPSPWYPTQKLPRPLSTCASLFRSLMHKTSLMGANVDGPANDSKFVGDVRKKWHISPAFSVEFISYVLDRSSRMQEMKAKLASLIKQNEELSKEETELRNLYDSCKKDHGALESETSALLNKALEIHDLLKSLAGRPLRLPPAVAALHNPSFEDTGKDMVRDKRLITKAATKMMTASVPNSVLDNNFKTTSPGSKNEAESSLKVNGCDAEDVMTMKLCSVCKLTKDQHLLIQCDTCVHFYHLSCLDPPLTRMPKKTKQMGWQCSDCCKSSDSDKTPEVDTAAPRRLRRATKEPNKFIEKFTKDQQISEYKSATATVTQSDKVSKDAASSKPVTKPVIKRRNSTDAVGTKAAKVQRKSVDNVTKESCETIPFSSTTNSDEKILTSPSSKSTPTPNAADNGSPTADVSADSLPSPNSESFPSEEDQTGSGNGKRDRKHHKDGGKKKKKDRNKDEVKKRKKHHHHHHHHHRDKYPVGEMPFPFKLKIKPLPPRPTEGDYDATVSADLAGRIPDSLPADSYDLVSNHTTSTTTAPPGYPPLPPGYTLTQPVMVPSSGEDPSKPVPRSVQTSNGSATNPRPPSVPVSASSSSKAGGAAGSRKSDSGVEQFSTCDVCAETGGVTNTVICDECHKAYHFNCLDPPLKKSPKRRGYSWFCEDCDNGSSNGSDEKPK